MSHNVEELRALPVEELIARHDAVAQSTSVGVSYYLEELARRDAAQAQVRMLGLTEEVARLTRVIAGLTIAMAVLTAASLVAVLASL